MQQTSADISPAETAAAARAAIGERSLVFVGLMGAGKSVIGRMSAAALGLPFVDSDHEIETASRMSIPDLFETYGEAEFRALEARVITRLLDDGPRIVSTGGGAFIDPATRALIKQRGLSLWLKADFEVLWTRVKRRNNRPLLKTDDPRRTLQTLIDSRYPVYAEADMTVHSRDVGKEIIVDEVVATVAARAVTP